MSEADVEAFYKQGVAFMGQEEFKKAIEFFDRAIEMDKEYLPAWNDKGVAMMEIKDYEGALECFNMVIFLNPDDILNYYNKGFIQLLLKRYRDAIKTFEFFIATYYSHKDDFYKFSLYLKAKAHYELKEYDQAHALLERAILKDRMFKEARDLIIEVLKEQKKSAD